MWSSQRVRSLWSGLAGSGLSLSQTSGFTSSLRRARRTRSTPTRTNSLRTLRVTEDWAAQGLARVWVRLINFLECFELPDLRLTIGRVAKSVVLLVVLVAAPASAQDRYPRGRIIGSVEIPALYGVVETESGKTRATAVTLYSQPVDGAKPVTVIKDRWEIESLEHASDQGSAGVLEMKDGWYLVQFKSAEQLGTGWLSPRDAGRFRWLRDILVGGMGFMTDTWDRILYDAPNRNAPRQLVRTVRDRQNAVVASTGGDPRDPQQYWLLVVLLDGSICDGGSRSVIASGWIPAYSTTGRLNTWHFSRGC
jgi:hypothetical protein